MCMEQGEEYTKGIITFMSLFVGRRDVYGINQVCIKEPLTKDVYDKHLKGMQRVGCYPITDNKYTKWIAIDIDDGDFEKAIAIQEKASHFGLQSYIERSKSKGYHVWTFFKEQVECVKPRLVFEMILDELEIKCEIFPKQDEVKDKAFGNFIFLPLFGGDIKHERTCFIHVSDSIFIDKAMDLQQIKPQELKILDDIIATNELARKKTVIVERQGGLGLPEGGGKILPCIDKMKDGVATGNRDMVCFRIAMYYKQRGMFKDDLFQLLLRWNGKNEQPRGKEYTDRDVRKTLESAWNSDYRGYGCEDPIVQTYCDMKECPMAKAKEKKRMIEEGVITMTFRDEQTMVFKKEEYEYRLTQFEFSKGSKFKCMVTLTKDEAMIVKDIISTGTASHRKRFAAHAKDETVDEDLMIIDTLVRKQLEKEAKELLKKKKQLYVMTEQEKQDAIKKLQDTPHLLSEVISLTNDMGVVGEEDLRLMVYLCFTSRITMDPISITVKGEASSGKSYSCTNIMKLIPEEGVKFITKATQQAFFHMDEDGLKHKIVYINEVPGQEAADYSIRSAQSEGDLVLMMPIKDPTTGDMQTVEKIVRGPAGFLSTTTKVSIFDENETRNFSVFSDDSPELTTRIGDIESRIAKGEDFIVPDKDLNLWKNMQRLLNPEFRVIIPYADEILKAFPSKPVRIRRDRRRFRFLIEVITLLHQFHREQKKTDKGMVIISTLADYHIAKLIAEDILTYTIFELGPSAEELWRGVKETEENYNQETQFAEEVPFTFTYKSIAEQIDWQKAKVKKWMTVILKANLIEYDKGSIGGKGRESIFKVSHKHQQWSKQNYSFLPKIEELFGKYPCDKELFYNPITGVKIDPVNPDAPDGLEDEVEDFSDAITV